jgi:hypothetical protein
LKFYQASTEVNLRLILNSSLNSFLTILHVNVFLRVLILKNERRITYRKVEFHPGINIHSCPWFLSSFSKTYKKEIHLPNDLFNLLKQE